MSPALASLIVNGAELALLIWLLIHLRHAAGPVLAALVEALRHEQDIMRRNLGSLSEQTIQDRHSQVQSHAQLWEELRRIHARLDEMRCPIGHADCPLDGKRG